MLRIHAPGLLVIAAFLSSCHVSDSGAVDTAAAEQACTLDARAYCEKRKTCWPQGVNDYRFQQTWGTLDRCLSDRKANCLASATRPGSGNDSARIQGCAMALQAQSCDNFQANVALPTSACPPVVGHLDNGTSCVANDQCKSAYCDRAEDQACGKCNDKGGIGTACDQTADCAAGLACISSPDTLSRTCMMPAPPPARARAGEPCGGMLPACDLGLTCVGMGAMKTCMADVATAGAPCDPTHKMLPDCDTNTAHLWCNRVSMTCEPQKLAAVNQPCSLLADGSFAVCSGGTRCVRPKGADGNRPAQGTCTAAVGENATCFRSSSDGPGCATTLRCVYDAVGAPTGQCQSQATVDCSKRPAHDAGAGG